MNVSLCIPTPAVLLVDDDVNFRAAWQTIFELEGWTVVTASNARDGLLAARQVHPNLIVTDYTMPEMTGAELCHHLRRDPQLHDLPVILWSAAEIPRILLECDAVLSKSVPYRTLVNTVRYFLGRDPLPTICPPGQLSTE